MSISLVQSAHAGNSTASFSSPTTAGNCVVVAVTDENGASAISGVTLGGSAGNFTQAGSIFGNSCLAAIWVDPNCAGGQTSVNFTATGLSDPNMAIYEFSGVAASSVVDKTSSSTGPGSSTAWSSGSTATTSQANEVYIGATATGQPGATVISGPGSPWTNVTVTDALKSIFGYQIASSTGTPAYSGTASFSDSQWASLIVTLKGAAGGAPVNVSLATAAATVTAPAPAVSVSVPLATAREAVAAGTPSVGFGPALVPARITVTANPPGILPIQLATARVTARANPVTAAIVTSLPAVRGAGSAATSSASATLNIANPSWSAITSSTPPGDVILIWCASYATSVTWSCSGFTAEPVAAGSFASAQLLRRVTTGSEGAVFTVTASSSHQFTAGAIGLYGENQSQPFDPVPPGSGSVANTSSTVIANSGVTLHSNHDALVWFGAAFSNSVPPAITLPSGYSAEITQANSGTPAAGIMIGYAPNAAAGATGAVNGSVPSSVLSASLLVGIQLPVSPSSYVGPAGPRPRWAPKLRRGRQFSPVLPQAPLGDQFPRFTRQGGMLPKWAPKLRRGRSFEIPPPQQNQGVRFPLFSRQGGYEPKWAPKLRRGRSFAPVPPQGNQGVQFPLFSRQYGGVLPRWAPKLRRGAFFMPGWGQAGNDPAATVFIRQAGIHPRWLPPRRVTRGRIFEPGWGQASKGVQFPLFTRQSMRRSVLGQLTRTRPSRTEMIPYVPQVRQASAALHGTGSMSAAAFLGRFAGAALHGTGSMSVAATRITQAAAAFAGQGSLRVSGIVGKQASAAMTGSGSMAVSATAVRAASAAMSGSGTMTASAAVLPGVAMTASGRLAVSASVTKEASAVFAAQGSLAVTATSGPRPRVILIEPGAVQSPEEITEDGTWQQRAPFAGPSQVTVTEVEDGQYPDNRES